MALSFAQTFALSRLIKPGMKIASMGYPDLIAPIEMIEKLGGDRKDWKYRKDSDEICKRHHLELCPIPDAESVFGSIGCQLEVLDIVKERGCEIICDLNLPFSYYRHKLETYDIVLDVGTLEHCFNIAQAGMNMASLLKQGGHILHENPFNWGNHGFYNLNPTWYLDFYRANGFNVLACALVNRFGAGNEAMTTKRFRSVGEELNVFCAAKREVLVKQMVFPVQSKYASLIKPVAGVEPGVEITNA